MSRTKTITVPGKVGWLFPPIDRRSVKLSFADLKKVLGQRGVVFDEKEYIRDVSWQMVWPGPILSIAIEKYDEKPYEHNLDEK